jgi:two-component system, cell cycle sensor histidine kinase and response regulator CckA
VTQFHRLLARQLRKAGINPADGATPEQLGRLLAGVDRSYIQTDRERYLLERSLMLSSNEMQELYESLRVNSETAIAEERDRLQAVLQALGDGLCILAADGTMTSANPAARDMIGAADVDVTGLAIDRFCTLLDSDGEAVAWDEVGRDDHRREEFGRLVRRNGETLPIGFVITAVVQRSGEASTVLVFRDISKRLAAEARERALKAQVSRGARMESLGLLAGGVAHDLNNILGPVVAYPGIMLQDLPDDSEMREDLLAISESAQRAVAVIQDLLMLAGRGAYNQGPLGLADAVESYLRGVDYQQRAAEFPGVEVVTKLNRELPEIAASWARVSQALMNLVINAFEAIGETGRIEIRTGIRRLDAPHIGFDCVPPGTWVCLQVTDTGTGIPREDLEHVFDPFYTKKKLGRSGTGLGLAVVWGVVKDADGYVDVQTHPDSGTSFTLYFRPAEAPVVLTPPPRRPIRSDLREHILVVDDSEAQRAVALRILSKLGYRVDTVSDGESAVEFLEQPVDLVLLDMVMNEGFDGLDTLAAIRQNHPSQRVVIVTGFSETARVRSCMELGVGGVLQKPYRTGELAEIVRSELDKVSK